MYEWRPIYVYLSLSVYIYIHMDELNDFTMTSLEWWLVQGIVHKPLYLAIFRLVNC